MSQKQAAQSSEPMPFGYYYGDNQHLKDDAPPSGPPLLDNTESDMLQNFFDNPNNIDPNFLTSPHEYHHPTPDNTNHQHHQHQHQHHQQQQQQPPPPPPPPPIQGDHTAGWMYNGQTHGYPNAAATAIMIPQHQHQSQHHVVDRQSFSAGGYSTHEPSEDVYAAARLLSNQQRNEGEQREQSDPIYVQQHQHRAGYHQDDLGYQHHSTPYHTNPFPYGTAPNRNGSIYEQPRPTTEIKPGTAVSPNDHSPQSATTKSGPLRFGSDDKFRGNFTGRMNQAPDQELTSTMLTHLDWVHKTTGAPLGRLFVEGNNRNKRERSQRQNDDDADDDDNQSGEDGDTRSRKRRKSKGKRIGGQDDDDDDDNEGDDDQYEYDESGRRRDSSASGRRKKWSDADQKAPRENLTEEQKRSNHIQSEQKRRNLIKQGFEDLTRMVPDLRAGGYSKSNMLLEAAKFIRKLQEQNDALKIHLQGFVDNG